MTLREGVKLAVLEALREGFALPLERLAYSHAEAAKILGRSPRTIARMIARNELHPVLVSGKWMISATELVRLTTPKEERRRGRPSRKGVSNPATRASVEALLKRRLP